MKKIFTKDKTAVSPIGFGTMPISAFYSHQPAPQDAVSLLIKAIQMGYNFIDTAMAYGNNTGGESESLVSEALSKLDREKIFISTKCGVAFEKGCFTLSGKKEHIFLDCDSSLERLKTSYIDVLFLHRIDLHASLEDSLLALVELKKLGKIRYIGVSEITASQIEQAISWLSGCGESLDFIQNEYSITSRQDEENGVLLLCEEHQINYVAYSPLGRGLLAEPHIIENKFTTIPTEDFRHHLPRFNKGGNLEHNIEVIKKISVLAQKCAATVSQIALAWLLRQGSKRGVNIIPIPGTKRISFLEENYNTLKSDFDSADLEKINHILNQYVIKGDRWPESAITFQKKQ